MAELKALPVGSAAMAHTFDAGMGQEWVAERHSRVAPSFDFWASLVFGLVVSASGLAFASLMIIGAFAN